MRKCLPVDLSLPLTSTQRKFATHFEAGLSHREIARLYHTSTQAVSATLSRARKRGTLPQIPAQTPRQRRTPEPPPSAIRSARIRERERQARELRRAELQQTLETLT
jgi:transposase